MILWTIQPASIYYQIQREGYYHYDESRSEDNESIYEFRTAYDWLAGEMCKRIGPPPKGVKYPVWAWYVHYSKRRKPDLRKAEYGINHEQMVCMEIDIPDDQVLLSDEEAWTLVLNNCYLSRATCHEDFNRDMAKLEKLTKEQKQASKIRSWQYIFDIEPFENDWFRKGSFIQATFWELKAEQIRKVQFFKAR
ncbi:MAG: DUF3841 domain-containing protein [Ruminococcus sp.]|nr:DUF3841 domain-containing protein [Ruminococcus sp.]